MIVSRKIEGDWKSLEGDFSRLSGPYYGDHYGDYYRVNSLRHRLYGGSIWKSWDLNDKPFWKFKGV